MTVSVLWLGGAAMAAPGRNGADAVALAQGLIDAEQFAQALTLLKQLEAEESAPPERIALLIGNLYLGQGKPERAGEFYEQALTSGSDGDAAAYLGLAQASLARGNLARARHDAAQALRSDTDFVGAQLVLADIDLRLGRAEDAQARLRRLGRDRPESEEAAIALARFTARQAGAVAGVAEIERFVAGHPGSAAARDVLGGLLWSAGERSEAIEARMAALRLYAAQGRAGRAEAMTAWLRSADPSGGWGDAGASPRDPADEPPPAEASPRPPVNGAPIGLVPAPVAVAPPPVPAAPKAPPFSALFRPQPLPAAPGARMVTGGGVVLEGGRHIVTNRRTVDGMRIVAVRTGTGLVRVARVAKVAQDDDLALLEVDEPFPDSAVTPLADIAEPAPGWAAIFMGFPPDGEQPVLSEGEAATGDSSGGPVVDRHGRLLGVAAATPAAAATASPAVGGGRILRFIGRTAAPDRANRPELTLEELYQRMLPRAVLVAAQN